MQRLGTQNRKKNTKKTSMMSRSTTEKQETKVGTGQKTNTNLTNEGESLKTAEGIEQGFKCKTESKKRQITNTETRGLI